MFACDKGSGKDCCLLHTFAASYRYEKADLMMADEERMTIGAAVA
jgi:hypothetical protein